MAVISVVNHKGGVGKSSTVANVSDEMANKGLKVLAIDIDPQENLTIGLGAGNIKEEKNIEKLMRSAYYDKGITSFDDTVIKLKEHFDLIPGNEDIEDLSYELKGSEGEYVLSDILRKCKKNYDHIIIDCPPSRGILTTNALIASDYVIIPINPEFYSLHGINKIIAKIEKIQSRTNPKLKILGAFISRYNKRASLHAEVTGAVEAYFKEIMFSTISYENIKIAEAPSFGKSVIEYAPDSIGAQTYRKLTVEILERIGALNE
jgi:chromosome partitioning protein